MLRRPALSLTVAVSLGVAIFFSLYSLIPVTRVDEAGLSSLFIGTMMFCVMGVQVFTPGLVRRFSLRVVIVASLLLLGAGALVAGWAPGTLVLLVGAVMSGAGFGILIVAGTQGIALLVSVAGLSRALGTYGLITMAASALGSPAGVQIALSFSPGVFGICAGGAALVAVGVSLGVGRAIGKAPGESEPEPVSRRPERQQRRMRLLVADAPWLALLLLLAAMVLFSHGLSSLPMMATAFGSAAVVVFAVQAGNALGRYVGGELDTRFATRATVITGAVILAVGSALGVLVGGAAAAILSGALIGLGVGVVQTVTLHVSLRRMGAGPASVMWNLAVDGGLWVGGILWGLAMSSGTVEAGVLFFAAVGLVAGALVVHQIRRTEE